MEQPHNLVSSEILQSLVVLLFVVLIVEESDAVYSHRGMVEGISFVIKWILNSALFFEVSERKDPVDTIAEVEADFCRALKSSWVFRLKKSGSNVNVLFVDICLIHWKLRWKTLGEETCTVTCSRSECGDKVHCLVKRGNRTLLKFTEIDPSQIASRVLEKLQLDVVPSVERVED